MQIFCTKDLTQQIKFLRKNEGSKLYNVGQYWDRYYLRVGIQSGIQPANWVNSTLYPSEVAKSSTSFARVKLNVNSAGWQVTLCDHIQHMSSHSDFVNCYTLVTLHYCI